MDLDRFATADETTDPVELQNRVAMMYRELKTLARRQLAGSAPATLNTTGLVHELYLKLAASQSAAELSRHHFFALAAKAMRQIVIDMARANAAGKRGGAAKQQVTLERVADIADADDDEPDVLKLNDALQDLQERHPALAELVELRFFAGLTMQEIAEVRAMSPRTLDREWRRAKTYLYTSLHGAG